MNITSNIIAYFYKRNSYILQYSSLTTPDSTTKEIVEYINKHRPDTIDELLFSNELQSYRTQAFISLLKDEYNIFNNKSDAEKERYITDTIEQLIHDTQKIAVTSLLSKDMVSYDQLSKEIEKETGIIVNNLLFTKKNTYFEVNSNTIETIFDEISTTGKRVSIGMGVLDKALGGGVPPDSFIIFLAPTGGGKTTLMSYLAGQLLKTGKNVAYISFEEDKKRITKYIMQSMLGVTTDYMNNNLEKVKVKVSDLFKNNKTGVLYVEDYIIDPNNYFSDNFRKFSRKALRSPYEFIDTFYHLDIDYLFVDYIGSMMNSGLFSGDSSYELGDAASRFLKQVSSGLNIPVISAQQVNREGLQIAVKDKGSSIDISKISGSVAIPFWADALFVMITDKRKSEATIFSLKNRVGAPVDALTMGIDFSTKQFGKAINSASV